MLGQGEPSLADAAMDQDAITVRQLIADGADPDALGQFDTPALHWLVRYDDMASAQLLLAAGADANISSRYGVTPLSLAVDEVRDGLR